MYGMENLRRDKDDLLAEIFCIKTRKKRTARFTNAFHPKHQPRQGPGPFGPKTVELKYDNCIWNDTKEEVPK